MHTAVERALLARQLKKAALSFVVAASVAVAPTALFLAPSPVLAAARISYYVDPLGADSAAGTSPGSAWRSLSRIPAGSLRAGDSVFLRRGGRFAGSLTISASGTSSQPVTVGAYGKGPRPILTNGGCLNVTGSYVKVRSLQTSNCAWAGITLAGAHDTVTNSRSSRNVTGIFVRSGATFARVIGNSIINNRRMSVNTPGGDDDSGAFGILVQGDRTTIDRNRIDGQHAESYDYGTDGSAIEIYGAVDTSIHHNTARNNMAFTELGDSRSRNTTYAYNAVTSNLRDSEFLVTRGANSGWGPVIGTRVVHNTVKLTGAGSQGVVCYDGCSSRILSMRGNVISAIWKVGYADHAFDTGNNIFWGGSVQFARRATDRVLAPRFASSRPHDVRLRRTSPAVDEATSSRWITDVLGQSLPIDGNGDGVSRADIGAFERRR